MTEIPEPPTRFPEVWLTMMSKGEILPTSNASVAQLALEAHNDLRERCLIAEMENGQLKSRLVGAMSNVIEARDALLPIEGIPRVEHAEHCIVVAIRALRGEP